MLKNIIISTSIDEYVDKVGNKSFITDNNQLTFIPKELCESNIKYKIYLDINVV